MAVITLRKARTIVRKTFEKAREMELKPLSVVVLDIGGNVIAFERQDGSSAGRFAIAHGKAYGAVMTGMSGSTQKTRAEEQAYFMQALNGAYGGKLLPVPGGVLVKDRRDRIIGSVGVTGDTSDNDAVAGQAGIEAAGLTAEI